MLLAGAAWAAWRNVHRGRADKQGAFRLAAFTFFLFVAIWIVSPHVDDVLDEQQRFFTSMGLALFVAGVLYLLYLGLEPFVRRSWPTMLVGWSRMLAGRIRDPLVGRDVLVGAALGAALALMNLATDLLPRQVRPARADSACDRPRYAPERARRWCSPCSRASTPACRTR